MSAKSYPCSQCVFKRPGQGKKLIGSKQAGELYYFVISGKQYVCGKRCKS